MSVLTGLLSGPLPPLRAGHGAVHAGQRLGPGRQRVMGHHVSRGRGRARYAAGRVRRASGSGRRPAASGRPGATSRPVSPSVTNSGMPPASVPTTGTPARLRLEHAQPEWLRGRRVDEDVEGAQDRGHVVDRSDEARTVAEQTSRLGPQRGLVGAVVERRRADHRQVAPAGRAVQHAPSPAPRRDALLGIDAADHPDDGLVGPATQPGPPRRVRRPGVEALGVDGLGDRRATVRWTIVPTVSATARLTAMVLRGQPHRCPEHAAAEPRAHQVVQLEDHRSPGQAAGDGAVQVAPQAVRVDDVHASGQPRQSPGARAGRRHLLARPERPGRPPSAVRKPEVGRGASNARAGGPRPTRHQRRRPGGEARVSGDPDVRPGAAPGREGSVRRPRPVATSRRRELVAHPTVRDQVGRHSRSSLHSRPHGRAVTARIAHHAAQGDPLQEHDLPGPRRRGDDSRPGGRSGRGVLRRRRSAGTFGHQPGAGAQVGQQEEPGPARSSAPLATAMTSRARWARGPTVYRTRRCPHSSAATRPADGRSWRRRRAMTCSAPGHVRVRRSHGPPGTSAAGSSARALGS